jgi:membrane protein DedA with SNARE-associated domain
MHQAQHIPQLVQALAPTIDKYGYLAVGTLVLLEDFGIPVPGETVLIAAAFYAGLGHLNIFLVILIGILGAVIGDNIGFVIGHFGGHPLVERFGKYVFMTPERVDKAEAFFKKHGGKVVVVARFIEGLRQANGIIAGISEMHWMKFILFNVIGATLWVTTWASIGYFGGNHINAFLRYQLYFSIGVVIVLVAFAGFHLFKKRRANRNDKT